MGIPSITINRANLDAALARLDRLVSMAPVREVVVNGIHIIARDGIPEGAILAVGRIEGREGEERTCAVIVNLKG